MALLLRKFDTPTNVFIIGKDFQGMPESFRIVDGYISITIKSDTSESPIETDGYVFVYTEEELIENHKKIWVEDNFDQEVAVLKDFVGEISLSIVENDIKDLLVDNFEEWFDIKEYTMYQHFPEVEYKDDVEREAIINITGDLLVSDSITPLSEVYERLGLTLSEEE